jgi:hypothetical protein
VLFDTDDVASPKNYSTQFRGVVPGNPSMLRFLPGPVFNVVGTNVRRGAEHRTIINAVLTRQPWDGRA